MSPWDRPGAGLNWISIELVLVEQTSPSMTGSFVYGGGGIRTHGTSMMYNGFRVRPVQPLRHSSVEAIKIKDFPRSAKTVGLYHSSSSSSNKAVLAVCASRVARFVSRRVRKKRPQQIAALCLHDTAQDLDVMVQPRVLHHVTQAATGARFRICRSIDQVWNSRQHKAPAHMWQGSSVTYMRQSSSRQEPSASAAAPMARISACAVGSRSPSV